MSSKKSKEKKEFPNINLIITDNRVFKFIFKHRRSFLIGFVSLLILLAIAGVSIDLDRNYQENQKLIADRSKIENEIKFWQSVSQKYPNYRDAYFKLAVLNYELRDFNKSKGFLNKTLEIDPNFKEGRQLEKKL